MSSADPIDGVSAILAQVKGTLSETQSAFEGLIGFFRERAQLEESYSKSLLKLSRNGLAISEKSLQPDMFEALACLKGDTANEGIQHGELATNINRDVVGPLLQLGVSTEMVNTMVRRRETGREEGGRQVLG